MPVLEITFILFRFTSETVKTKIIKSSKMKQFFAVCILSVCAALVCCQDNQEGLYEEREEPLVLLPLPLIRVRRQATTNWKLESPGITGTVEHKGTIINNGRHQLDGSAYLQKDISRNLNLLQPDRAGGKLDYHFKPSQSTLSLGADHTRGFGTDITAGGQYNIIQKKNFELGVGGEYTRHYGGIGGTRHPDAGVFLRATGRF